MPPGIFRAVVVHSRRSAVDVDPPGRSFQSSTGWEPTTPCFGRSRFRSAAVNSTSTLVDIQFCRLRGSSVARVRRG